MVAPGRRWRDGKEEPLIGGRATGGTAVLGGWVGRHAADAVTGVRLVLTPALAIAILLAAAGRSGWPAAVLFALIAVSDLVDGWLARRLGTESERGRLLDHGADIVFLLTTLGIYAWLGLTPWWVPAAIGLSFAAYVVDSWARSGGPVPGLVVSRVGHVGGVLNYVLVGVLVGNETLGVRALSPAVLTLLFVMVPIYSAIGLVSRWRGVR